MKVTKAQAQINREALLDAASALFKQHGIDGVGVADVCRQAGLTHGALYKHFADKEDLAAQSFAHAFRKGYDRVTAVRPGRTRNLGTYLDTYLSPRVRDDMSAGCPLVAAAGEVGRQGAPLGRSFTDAFVELRDGVASVMPPGSEPSQRQAWATTMVAAFIGAMAISRGVVKVDPALANEVLAQVRSTLEALPSSQGESAEQ